MNFIISEPFYRDHMGVFHQLLSAGDNRYMDQRVEVVLKTVQQDKMALRIEHTWRSLCGEIEIQPVLQIEDTFVCDDYLIPCVTIHGNHWGGGKEPKGLVCEGKPWVFDARRTGIPGCTLTENSEAFCALYACNDSPESLTVSCSLVKLHDGRMQHRLLYPTIEEPLTYCDRDCYSDGFQTFVKLDERTAFSARAIVLSGKPERRHYAMIEVQNAVQSYLTDIPEPALSRNEMWSLSISFAEKLLYDYHGNELFIIGHLLKPEGTVLREDFEIGWCGQNGMYARMMILDYMKTRNHSHLETAIKCLDAWSSAIHPVSGLPWTHFENVGKNVAVSDTCNLSFYISELLASYLLLKKIGIEKPAYREAAIRVANFLERHRSEEFGLGKAWRVGTGECVDQGGTIGAYPIHSFVEVYKNTGDDRYLQAARDLMCFYYERDMLGFECTAGALDTECIDKETSGALIMGGMALFEETGERQYLEETCMAAEYFCSWMYYYDVPCNPASDFALYGYHTLGGTAVSVQHHCIDTWGVLMVSYLMKLAQYTGDNKWRQRAQALWFGGTQVITRRDGDSVHGLKRLAGSINEVYLPSRWQTLDTTLHPAEYGTCGAPGSFNDWLVAWPGAFRMYTIIELEKIGE